MKRCRLGAGLLVGLLAIGLIATFWTHRRFTELSRDIQLAGEAASLLDWERAEDLTRKAKEHWQSGWALSAALTDHEPLEQIDGLFAQLEIYAREKDSLSYSVLCARLCREIAAIAEAQSPGLWNIL